MNDSPAGSDGPQGKARPEPAAADSPDEKLVSRDGADEIVAEVYDELRGLARAHMGRQRRDHTLQATALSHEAYMRLRRQSAARWKSRSHFLAVAARAMRQILIDYERGRVAEKRGGGARKLQLDEIASLSVDPQPDLLELDRALEKLATTEPRKARVVELIYFGGMKAAEVAEALEVGLRTVERDWQFARAWLFREISGGDRD